MVTDTSNNQSESADETQAAPEQAAAEEVVAPKAPSAEEKLQEAEKKYLYLYAEFENFCRRVERDRSDFLKFGHDGLLRDLLQVLYNFERAIAHAKSLHTEKGSPLAQVSQGIEMIHYQMAEVLKSQGVASIESLGKKFDPNFHEAVGEEESEAEPGTVVKEMQKGYLLHGKLLRAARVFTAKQKI